MSEAKQVITIDDISADNAPTIYVAGGLDKFFAAVEKEVTGEVPDLTTAKGRARIASLAAKVSSSKAAVEKPGRDYLRKLKEMPKVIEVELAAWVKKMDALRDTTRKPLNDWETEQQARKDRHVDAVQAIHDFCIDLADVSASVLLESIASVEAVQMGDHWEEFETEAARAKESTLVKLRAALTARQQYEAEQAELIRLRAESEAQAQRDREAQIAREAEERAKADADLAAKLEREAVAQREKDAKDAAEKRELELKWKAEQSERLAIQAKADQLAAEQRATQQQIRDQQLHDQAIADAEAARIATEQRAEQYRINAAKAQAAAVEKARLDEQARQEAEAAEVIRQQKARQADVAHKSKILGEAKQAIMSMNVSEELAKAIVLKIARGEVPNVTITF